jgi:enamine deaminase RidA (YjgF/YER057c/UK114 family)
MMGVRRVPGQMTMFPGAVRAQGTIYTSGVVDPGALAALRRGDAAPPFRAQLEGALLALLRSLNESGAGRDEVVKVDAFLASHSHIQEWNRAFLEAWPEVRPARTTLITDFGETGILVELQAIAHVE